ncbi:MAG: quinone-dependent dihydroorotate dehydrogenase [Candidatus Saccharibacteria bacterium]
MIRPLVWKICRLLYVRGAKPLLFLMAPDNVHRGTIRIAAAIGSFPITTALIRLIFRSPRDERLVQTYHGIEFATPVGLAAGFDKNGQIVPTIAALGFGFTSVGSVTANQCRGNERPWFYRLPKTRSLVVNAGLANDGSRIIIKRLRRLRPQLVERFPIVLSVAKTNSRKVVDETTSIADYVTTLKRASRQPNISQIELNISCPNTYGGEPFTTVNRLDHLLSAIDEVGATQPIYVKMPTNLPWSDFQRLLDVIVLHRISGVTISNLAKDRSNLDIQDVLPDSVAGNLSGKPTEKTSNELIRRTYLHCADKLTIIGVGGIFSADDAYQKIRLGAGLVELITGLIYCGPQLAAEINDGLSKRLARDGLVHISQAIGLDAPTG